jgi:predicted RecB family nuclease
MYRRDDGTLIVSATDLVGFLACGHLTQLERAAAAGLVEKPVRDDPEIELLRRRGYAHEQRYIEKLRGQGRQVTELPEEDGSGERLSYEARAGQTVEAMRRGDDVIFQATVFDGRWVGHPDFLLRTPGASIFGDYHYEVADTKLAHSVRASALIQICSYVDQIERLQGVRPEHVYVVLGGATIKTERFRTAEMMAYYRRAKSRFEETVDDALAGTPLYPPTVTYPDPVEHCGVCRWSWIECKPLWRRHDALPLVAGISKTQREHLREAFISTRRALGAATVEPKYQRVREQARLQVESSDAGVLKYELLEPERDADGALVADRGLAALPEPSAGDLFFDIEGDPFAFNQGLDYLFGVWQSGAAEPAAWTAIWAVDLAQEKQAFERVMDFFMGHWESDPNMHIYHYAAYEPSALKRLAGRHATREEELDQLLRARVFVDLYRVVRQGVRVGAEGYSIKDLEPLYSFARRIDLRTAGKSIVEFELYLEQGDPDGTVLQQIELYNKDDCVSTWRLRDWLEHRRPEAEARFGIALPRPPTEVQEASEELTERQRAVRELEARLTDGIASDPTFQTPADRATWLVAHLLDWHRRENKSTFWRFYDLLSRSDDELFGENEPIARLEYLGVVAGGGTKQSDDHRYSFPPQEYRVEKENEVHDPRLPVNGTRTGTVQAIDKDASTVDIRRRKGWNGPHPTSIVPLNVYGARAQQDALMRLGNWVAEHGIDSPDTTWRAARDLLLRRAPRAGQAEHEELVRQAAGESGTEAARRLALALDGTTLAIQGPPGSGKTYSGARMIVDLVRAGRRAGITSNSHKVIGNLLRAACEAAEEMGVTLRALQKGSEDEVIRHPFVKRASENGNVDRALVEGEADVVAGTPWLWARAEIEQQVDTLFVDEAGQVSLANVVAVSGAARDVVLLGDPQQLDQPTQGVHPDGAGGSALGHFLGSDETVALDRGVFLERTFRLHPEICRFTSDLFYAARLEPIADLGNQRVLGDGWLGGSGIRWLPVEHDGNTNSSVEEADAVCELWSSLVGRTWLDRSSRERTIGPEDIVIVSPFNAHRLLIQERLPRARVGTVDKFQGQEAPVAIYTMATSRAEDAPRGLGFLYSLNRLNVATSRARALAIVVCAPTLLEAVAKTPDQLRMANGLCAFVEAASRPPEAKQLAAK